MYIIKIKGLKKGGGEVWFILIIKKNKYKFLSLFKKILVMLFNMMCENVIIVWVGEIWC